MTKEEIIELAKQAGFEEHQAKFDTRFEPFAKLVAEHERDACTAHAITAAEKAIDVAIKLEREACANVCEEMAVKDNLTNYYKVAANAIKARGNHD